MAESYYVYEHRRVDTCAIFYVGKGSGGRAKTDQGRNKYWRNVVNKCGGYYVEIIVSDVDEELAHLAEIARIDQLRRIGVALTNLTDGGEGASGYRQDKETIERRASKMRGRKRPDISKRLSGVPKSEEHRKKLSLARTGMKHSQKSREKMSASRTGRPGPMRGKKHHETTKAKISAAVRGEKNPFFGKTHSPEIMQIIVAANLGRKESEETRAKKSAARKGEKNPRYGVVISEDQKARQIASLKARPHVTCQHCGKTMDESNAKRWHMDNCKERA